MFLRNDVLRYVDAPGRMIRILWIDPAARLAYTFELRRGGANPQAAPLHTLRADIQAGRARLVLPDPCRMVRDASAMPSMRQLRLQLKAWRAIQAMHRHQPALYLQAARAPLLAACAAQQGVPATTILRYLRRYWERGQTIEALLPDYANSGARGKAREASAGIKRGRPSGAALAGPNVDAALRAIFQAAVAHHAATHARFSGPAAYRQMLATYFSDREPGAVPSYGQFDYWRKRDCRGRE